MAATDLEPSVELLRMSSAAWLSQALGVAAKLGIADLLADGPKSLDELARETESHAPSLYRLLRALASAGIFAENEQRQFEMTPLANGLRSDVPGSVRAVCALRSLPWLWDAWGNLLHSIQTGETAFNLLHGTDLFSYLGRDPDALSLFAQAMGSLSATEVAAVLAAYDFSLFGTIVDVGGGRGYLLSAILAAHPAARGVLFDLPSTVAQAPGILDGAGVRDRCEVVGGNFFDEVPGGGDLYVLKSIIHDWDDERAIAILQTCRRSTIADARLLLIERVVRAGNGPSFSKWMDLNMMVVAGGRERTEAEYRSLSSTHSPASSSRGSS
jgi:hypothetical protein